LEPLTRRTEEPVKFVPVAVSVKVELPVSTVVGLMLPRAGAGTCADVVVGAGLMLGGGLLGGGLGLGTLVGAVTVKFWMADVPPPGAGVMTEIFRDPTAARSPAGMVATS
jgi:hypothetical protein